MSGTNGSHGNPRHPRRRGRLAAGIGVATLTLAAAAYWALLPAEPVEEADPANSALVAAGRTIYAAHCAACHGAALEGQPNWRTPNPDGTLPAPPHDASGHTWHHPDAVLLRITRLGGQAVAPAGFISAMPAFGDKLDARETRAVLAFIKSTWPADIRARQEAINRRAVKN